ncbi:MAG: DUF2793 domain-containing protein [Pseudomonadota bacterium]
MSDTNLLKLPLLDAAQAQKHVTLNEALVRTDVLAAARAEGVVFAEPAAPADGTAWIVGTAAGGVFVGHDDKLALFLNGGWEFVSPWAGARFWVADEALWATFDGADWVTDHVAGSPGGAATLMRVIEHDHVLAAGTTSSTDPVIPDKAIVIGVTARVTEAIGGAGSWSLGIAGSPDRYGSGYGTGVGGFAHGVTGQPQAYYGGTSLDVTSNGPAFTSGRLTIAVHCLEIAPPA